MWQRLPMREQGRGRTISPRITAGGVVVLLFLIFIAENSKKTKIRFIIPEVTAPLWMGLTAAGLLGVLAGGLAVHLLADHRDAKAYNRLRDRQDPSAD